MTTLPDEPLIERVAAATPTRSRVLYRRYERPVFAVLLRLGGQRALAEEWLQEAFTRVWLAAGSHDPRAAQVQPWIYAIALNTARSELARKRHRDAPRLDRRGRDWTCPTRAGGEPSLARAARRGDAGERPRRARSSSCPDYMREVVVLRCSRELSFAEIAEVTGAPAGDAEVALPPRRAGAARGPRAASAGEGAMRHPSPGALLELHFGEAPARGARRSTRTCASCARVRGVRRASCAASSARSRAARTTLRRADGLERVLARVAAVRPARARRAEWLLAVVPSAAALVAGAWAIRAGGERLTALGLVPGASLGPSRPSCWACRSRRSVSSRWARS